MCLKRQYINFDQSCLTIPILHFRKSSMPAILRQYKHIGVNHLAKLCGYILKNQWNYIKNLFSINKSLEFLEKLCDSLHLAASYEFYIYLLESKLIDVKTIFEWRKESLGKVLLVLKDVIDKCCADDKVFQKNIDLLKVIKTIVSHYTEERSKLAPSHCSVKRIDSYWNDKQLYSIWTNFNWVSISPILFSRTVLRFNERRLFYLISKCR